jgi:hypothetical protein
MDGLFEDIKDEPGAKFGTVSQPTWQRALRATARDRAGDLQRGAQEVLP